MPLVTIVVPVYKNENNLHYCVDSVLRQSFKDFELILVDDGSPDNSAKICDDYAVKDRRVKVIHKKNGGVSSARNAGIDQAKGNYICFVDSDDYLHSDFLKYLVNSKQKFEDFNSIWCRFKPVSDYSCINSKLCNAENAEFSFYSYNEIMTLHERWLNSTPFCKLYDMDLINQSQTRFDENLSLVEDLRFNFDYLDITNGKILVIEQELYYYMTGNEESGSNRYYSNMFDIYKKNNQMMLTYLNKWGCSSEQLGKYYNACFYKYEVVLKNTFSKNNTQSNIEKYRYNRTIMKSIEFKESFENMSHSIHLLYRIAYKSCSYHLVRIVDKLVALKKR